MVCSTVAVNGIRVAPPERASTRQKPPCAQMAMTEPSGQPVVLRVHAVDRPRLLHVPLETVPERPLLARLQVPQPELRVQTHPADEAQEPAVRGLSRGVMAPPEPPVTRSVSPVTRSRRRMA
jgi:hypothetical protein